MGDEGKPRKVKVRIAPGRSLRMDKPKGGKYPPNRQAGEIVELDADEAARLLERGVVLRPDAEPPATVPPDRLRITAQS